MNFRGAVSMIIRKLYKFEAGHIVRNCSSTRCKYSFHGHSYKIEVFLSSDKLDNGQMVFDFGLLKSTVGKFLDQFDHSWHYWKKESQETKNFIHNFNHRWVEFPFSPSAENYSIYFLKAINQILGGMEFKNGEGSVKCTSVRVHETDTGYAESSLEDLKWHDYYDLSEVKISAIED